MSHGENSNNYQSLTEDVLNLWNMEDDGEFDEDAEDW